MYQGQSLSGNIATPLLVTISVRLRLPMINPNRSLECLFFAKSSTTDEEEQIAKSKYLMTDLSKQKSCYISKTERL